MYRFGFRLEDQVLFEAEGESGAAPEAEATAAEPAAAEPAVAEPVAEPAAPAAQDDSWAHSRIAKLTARLRAAEEREAALRAQMGGTTTAEAANSEAAPLPPPAAFNSAVQTAASELIFQQQCQAAQQAGIAAYGAEFQNSINEIMTKAVDSTDPASMNAYKSFLRVALASGEAPRIVYEMGKRTGDLSRILSLPLEAMAFEVSRMTQPKAPNVEPSAAPKPITPVTNHSPQHTPIDPADATRHSNLSTDEWMRRRNAQISSARAEGRRLQ